MPKSLENQLSYSGGEFSPLLDARADHPKYSKACRKLQNMIAMKQGGATRRPGTRFIATAKYSDPNLTIRLLKFQFSPTTSFVIEMGHYYFRFYSNGQQVVLSSAATWVSGTTYQPGAFVEDPTDSDNIYFYTGSIAFVSVTAPSLDSNWTLQSIYEVPSPYPSDAGYGSVVLEVTPCQINDIVYICHPDYPVYKLTRVTDTNWTMAEVNFLTPALLDQNITGVFIGASALNGTITLSANAATWVTATYYQVGDSVNPGGAVYTCIVSHISGTFAIDLTNGFWELETIFENGQIGGYFQLAHPRDAAFVQLNITVDGTSSEIEASGSCELATYGTWTADVELQRSDDRGATWTVVRTITSRADHNASIPLTVAGNALFRIEVVNWVSVGGTTTPRAVFTANNAVVYGLVRILAVANAYSATAEVVTQLASVNTTTLWSEGAWSTLRGYPRAVTVFQQRMIYGGTYFEPQRIWGSVTNDIENFALGDQLLSTDSFAFDIAATGRGPIQWLIAQVDLFIGFSGAEWIVNAGAGALGGSTDAITPTQISAGEHSSWGSAPFIGPAVVGNAVLYPQRSAKTIQQMLFSVYTNKYMSADLTSLSEHLFSAGIAQLDYQAQFRNQGIVWVVTRGGSLCGMTYQLEQEVFGWHRHITGINEDDTQDFGFLSVAVIDGSGVNDDEVWLAVRRDSGVFVELMNPVNWETDGNVVLGVAQPDIKRAFYVDCGITVEYPTSNVIGGLEHLIGRTVCCLLNGNIAITDLVVDASGEVTIENYEPEPVNSDILQLGLPIDYAVQPMRMDSDLRIGYTMGVTKVLSKMFVRLFNSLSGRVAQPDTDNEAPIIYRTPTVPSGEGPPIFTGEKTVQNFSNTGTDPSFIIQGRDPLPLTLLATITRIDMTGGA